MSFRLGCGKCRCFKAENPEPVKFDEKRNPIYNGLCLCHGYYLRSDEEICPDFER